jgi:hypothetical protein
MAQYFTMSTCHTQRPSSLLAPIVKLAIIGTVTTLYAAAQYRLRWPFDPASLTWLGSEWSVEAGHRGQSCGVAANRSYCRLKA